MEIELSIGGNGHSQCHNEHVDQSGEAETLDTKSTADAEDCYWHESFEHLDERDTKIQVGRIAEPERAGKESSNGYNCLHACNAQ